MSTLVVARKDVRDAIRSRSLLALVVLFVLFAGGATYFFGQVVGLDSTNGASPAIDLFASLIGPITIFVPLIGVATGYKSIVGERESGTVKLLLSLPHARRDVVLGKTIGRIAVLGVAILAGFLVAGAIAVASYDSVPIGAYVLFTLTTIVYGAVYLVFTIGLSAATRSISVALWGGLGFFVLFQFLWSFVVNLLIYVTHGLSVPSEFSLTGGALAFRASESAPEWYRLVLSLSPSSAYQRALRLILPNSADLGPVGGSLPYYLQNWFGFVVLALWLAIPLVLGYARFRRADI